MLSTLVLAVLLILGYGAPGFFLTRQLDVHQAQAGVQHILTDAAGYDARNVDDVNCKGGHNPTVKKGDTFTCEATIHRVRGSSPSSSPTMRAATRLAAHGSARRAS